MHSGLVRQPPFSGKLGFAIAAAFGRVGRARIGPIRRRSYQWARKLTFQLTACLRWWLRFLDTYRPREVPSVSLSTLLIVSYSDGEGASARIGVAAWASWLEFPVAAYTEVPQWLRDTWAQLAGRRSWWDGPAALPRKVSNLTSAL